MSFGTCRVCREDFPAFDHHEDKNVCPACAGTLEAARVAARLPAPRPPARLRFTTVNICGHDFPAMIDMTLPGDELWLASYDAQGRVVSRVRIPVEDMLKPAEGGPS